MTIFTVEEKVTVKVNEDIEELWLRMSSRMDSRGKSEGGYGERGKKG